MLNFGQGEVFKILWNGIVFDPEKRERTIVRDVSASNLYLFQLHHSNIVTVEGLKRLP